MRKTALITFASALLMFFATSLNAQTIAATKLTPAKSVQKSDNSTMCMMKPTEEALKNLKAYPLTIDTLERYVIYLGERENEELFKVELIPGKTMLVDCNQHRLLGQLKEKIVEGWGYTYHVFETEGHVASTMMMCMDPKTEKFVSGGSELVRYNSRLPIVMYLPKGMELKYKIWSAGQEYAAEQK